MDLFTPVLILAFGKEVGVMYDNTTPKGFTKAACEARLAEMKESYRYPGVSVVANGTHCKAVVSPEATAAPKPDPVTKHGNPRKVKDVKPAPTPVPIATPEPEKKPEPAPAPAPKEKYRGLKFWQWD
jgi:outer membrane biosynthesis protein TonB